MFLWFEFRQLWTTSLCLERVANSPRSSSLSSTFKVEPRGWTSIESIDALGTSVPHRVNMWKHPWIPSTKHRFKVTKSYICLSLLFLRALSIYLNDISYSKFDFWTASRFPVLCVSKLRTIELCMVDCLQRTTVPWEFPDARRLWLRYAEMHKSSCLKTQNINEW